jgi:hypothetical protein
MPKNIVSNYVSVQDGVVYHIKQYPIDADKVIFFDESYQSVGKARTNLEQPYRIPNCEKFTVKGIKIRFFPKINDFSNQKLPLFSVKLIVSEQELFVGHISELYSNMFSFFDFQNANMIEPILPFSSFSNGFGFTKGLEVDILKDVSFRVELSDFVVKFLNYGGTPNIEVVLVGTFVRKIYG